MSQDEIKSKVGEAWKAHFDGSNAAAVELFKQVVEQEPTHVDAYWGLGLSYRKSGEKENALQAFEKVRDLIAGALEAEPENYERLLMLNRMVKQQIEQMDDFLD
ncbi:MAG: bacterial transcriptional activator domain-containing protein [Anaerolineae bacterium]|nr:bacterial transcriptional activator domain-containing protein [Anaerolineae bacterium]